MPVCSFCGNKFEKGTGKLLVLNTGKLLWFCSSKCEKNMMKLKRDPKSVKWTETSRKFKSKER
ncbi:MAG: 50S ribosomal protein L24e [Candidatus Aenigmarchaeota archaeon]|nr:50S ribosomal protein L24e [Candidatus Aenigmarchaeota archaeon]OYT58265.1 MAG: 50S ribosomal protein L24e [Candidatus Aenigmarchaeota archaeon ex4484_14]RLI97419.1 MAG: 50S ribosomal protein L24e [Candidatus Aenigmarchaeota archaeon]